MTTPGRHAPRRAPVLVGLLLLGVTLLALLGALAGPARGAEAAAPPPSDRTLAMATTPAPTEPAPTGGAAPTGAGERVIGTLRNEGAMVPGATVRVEQDGQVVGSAVSDGRGSFTVMVPGPGQYTAVLETDTLPEGVAVRNEGGEMVEVSVRPGGIGPAPFILGEASDSGSRIGVLFGQRLIDGIRYGLTIAMAAIGLSLIFGTTGLTNFAHGELVTFGALATLVFNTTFGIHLIPAALLGIAVGGLFGAGLDRGLWGPLRRRGTGLIAALVVSIGLSLLLRYGFLFFFGGSTRPYAQYATPSPISIGPLTITVRDLVMIAVSLVVLTAVGLALQRTKLGKATRAVADNPSLAASSGIDVERVITVVWIVGTALAAFGGVLLGLSQRVAFDSGFLILLLLFAAVTLGGLGTAFGAFLGSIIVGVLTQVSTLVIPAELQNVGALLLLIVILIVRPSGLLGRAERVG